MKFKDFNRITLVFLIIFFSSSCEITQQQKLTIATAANVQFAMQELIERFSSETNIQCETIVSSSGKLTAQIQEGAPFDVFVSANMLYPNTLFENGFAIEAPKIYAYGNIVLCTFKKDFDLSINNLELEDIQHIAIPNPKSAPYGIAAMEALNHFGVFEKIKNKLVYGESISQTNQFLKSHAAEVGFTAKSIVVSPKIKDHVKWIDIPTTAYQPIAQGVVVIQRKDNDIENAQRFYNFLFSENAQLILEKYGYLTK